MWHTTPTFVRVKLEGEGTTSLGFHTMCKIFGARDGGMKFVLFEPVNKMLHCAEPVLMCKGPIRNSHPSAHTARLAQIA